MKTENKRNPSQHEKKLNTVEMLTDVLYGIIEDVGKGLNLSLNDEIFVKNVYGALNELKLRLYEKTQEVSKTDQEK